MSDKVNKYDSPATREFLVELRSVQGVKWDVVGGIVDQFNAQFGTELKTAIPLRRVFHAATEAGAAKATPASIRNLRNAGHGWARIAARTGISIGDAQRLYAKAPKATQPAEGRIYTRRDGSTNWSPGAAIVARERKAAS